MGIVKLLKFIVMLVFFIDRGSSLSCYQCNSLSDANCKDSSKMKSTPCPDIKVTPVCILFKAINTNTNQEETFRNCTFAKGQNDPCEVMENKYRSKQIYKSQFVCDTCSHDGCNGVSALYPMSLSFLMASYLLLGLRNIS